MFYRIIVYSYSWLAWFLIEHCDCTLVILWLKVNRLETNFGTWHYYLRDTLGYISIYGYRSRSRVNNVFIKWIPFSCTNLTPSASFPVQITPEVIQLEGYWGRWCHFLGAYFKLFEASILSPLSPLFPSISLSLWMSLHIWIPTQTIYFMQICFPPYIISPPTFLR